MPKNIQILDCTLRDGGWALMDKENENTDYLKYDPLTLSSLAENIGKSKVDIIELGMVDVKKNEKPQFAIFSRIEDVSGIMPKKCFDHQKHAVFFRSPDVPIDSIPIRTNELCDMARLSIRYSEIERSLDYCRKLKGKGYDVFIQLSVTMRYTMHDLAKIIQEANDINVYALYIVDTYGYMSLADTERLAKLFDRELDKNIKIGFHAHNNLGLAGANTIHFIESISENRDIIVDSCCMGMGQGAGNIQTEFLVSYLNEKYEKKYDFISILDACDIVSRYWTDNLWGYSTTALIPAVYKVAYKYSTVLRYEYNMRFSQIASVLKQIKGDDKYRFRRTCLDEILGSVM